MLLLSASMNYLKFKPWHHCAGCLRQLGYGTARISGVLGKHPRSVKRFVRKFGFNIVRPEIPGFYRRKPRKPKRVTHKFVQCVLCLYQLSFGCNRVSKQLFGSKRYSTSVQGWLERHCPKRDDRATLAYRRLHPPLPQKPRRDIEATWQTIPYRKLNLYLSQRVSMFLRRGQHAKRMEQLIGCSQQHFRNHIESQFHSGMSFDNYGTLWEIDHRLPQSAFNLRSQLERHQCYHYTNLQPLLVSQNARKAISCPLPVFLPHTDLRLDPAKLRFPRQFS